MQHYYVETVAKKLKEATKKFKENENLDEFSEEIKKIAKRTDDCIFTNIAIARYMNLELHKGKDYECEEAKSRKWKCSECKYFVNEAFTCLENLVMTSIYRIIHPKYKPPNFEVNTRSFNKRLCP